MSDFLATLAARARPAAPPIEPRRASRFESPGRDPAPAGPGREQISAPVAPMPVPGTTALPETPRPSPPQFQPAAAAPPKAQRTAVAPPEILPARQTASALVLDPVRAMANDRLPASSVHEQAPLLKREIPATIPAAPAISPVNPVIIEKNIFTAVPPAVAPMAAEPRPAPPEFRVNPRLDPPAVRLIEPAVQASPQASDELETSGAPAIHVTIGRVEVRAVVPPAAPPSPARSAPRKPDSVIPLGDYLRQQGNSRA